MAHGEIVGWEFNGELFPTYAASELQRSEWLDQRGEIPEEQLVVFACCNCGARATETVGGHHCCAAADCQWLLHGGEDYQRAHGVTLRCVALSTD